MYANLEVTDPRAMDGESPERVYSHALAIENGVPSSAWTTTRPRSAGERRVDLATRADVSVYANF
jgi:hypothetical protein